MNKFTSRAMPLCVTLLRFCLAVMKLSIDQSRLVTHFMKFTLIRTRHTGSCEQS
jgi:hypothetical protein